MTLASDQALVGDTRRDADHAAEDLTRRVEPRSRPGLSRLAWRRHHYWILAILGLFWEPIWPPASMSSGQTSARWCAGSVLSRQRSAPACTTVSPGPLIAW